MKPHRSPLSCAALAVLALAAIAPTANAATADASLTGGTLSFIGGTPGNVTFPSVALDGTNKTTTQTQPFNVSDARGSGVGWNITATSTNFVSGGNSLPNQPRMLTAPTATCDSGVTCTPATMSGVSYPYLLPMGGTAPPATRMFNANTDTGLGAQTITPSWQLSIPAYARAGNYTSTWTFSLVSGP
ncbi:MAG: hypothetical protein Q7T55_00780 [Solirubrobacteraceae bacterium]|nr:hypothetical protein [Solirubrobacteraceae bacterium]